MKFNIKFLILITLYIFCSSFSADAFSFNKKKQNPVKTAPKLYPRESLHVEKSFSSADKSKRYLFKADIKIPADEEFMRIEYFFDEYKDIAIREIIWNSGETGYKPYDVKNRPAPLNELDQSPEDFIDNMYEKKSHRVIRDFYFSQKIIDTNKSQSLKLMYEDGAKAKIDLNIFTSSPILSARPLEEDVINRASEVEYLDHSIENETNQKNNFQYKDAQIDSRTQIQPMTKVNPKEDIEEQEKQKAYLKFLEDQQKMYAQSMGAYMQGYGAVMNPVMQGGLNPYSYGQFNPLNNPFFYGDDSENGFSSPFMAPGFYPGAGGTAPNMMSPYGNPYGNGMNPYGAPQFQNPGFGYPQGAPGQYQQNQLQQNGSGIDALDQRIDQLEGF